MKKHFPVAVLAVLFVAGGLALAAPSMLASPPPIDGALMSKFDVQGMTCGGCEAGIRRGVKNLDGVIDVRASYKTGSAEVTFDPAKVTPEQIAQAIEKVGYQAELASTTEAPVRSEDPGALKRFLSCC